MHILWGLILTLYFDILFRHRNTVLCQDYPHSFPGDNGALRLILRAYSESLIRELREMDPEDGQVTRDQTRLIQNRLRDLYEHVLNHPALHQRYLWVGNVKPTNDPDDVKVMSKSQRKLGVNEEVYKTSKSKKASMKDKTGIYSNTERRQLLLPSEEICKTDRRWERLNVTQDFYDNEVEIVQDDVQQYVFTYRCVAERGACVGIAPPYDSECAERYGWIYMFYRRKDAPELSPQWGYVATPHHCACKITPKYFKTET